MIKRTCPKCGRTFDLEPQYFKVCKKDPLILSKTCKNCWRDTVSITQRKFYLNAQDARIKFINTRSSIIKRGD